MRGLLQAGHNLEQRRFTRAVFAHQRHAFIFIQYE